LTRIVFTVRDGRQTRKVTIRATRHAHWEDNHYERLKARMKACHNTPDHEIIERGFIYDVLEDKDERWYLARTSVESIGRFDGRCEQRPPGITQLQSFASEAALLDSLKANLNPDDEYCFVRNLLGDWERFDLLNMWLADVS